MAHHRMGLCEAPNSTGETTYLCQYCRTPAKDIVYPRRITNAPTLDIQPRPGALFPNIPMDRRVPDLLHMVKNVTKYILEKTGKEIHRNKRKQKQWTDDLMNPFLNKARKYSNSSTPRSLDTAYWEFMKDEGGINELFKISNEKMKLKRRIPLEEEKWTNILSIIISWKNIYNIIKSVDIIDIEQLKFEIGTFKNNIIKLNWKCTPWVHILIYHYIEFEKMNVRPIFLSCHAIEGHHRQIKKDFAHSLHSTKRRNKHSGLIDILSYDNIIINLISKSIFPWNKLKYPIGIKISEPKKGFFYNYIRDKYPILYPLDDYESNEDQGENMDIDLVNISNSDYNPEDTSDTED